MHDEISQTLMCPKYQLTKTVAIYLMNMKYDPTLAPKTSEDQKIESQIILQSLSCPKRDCEEYCSEIHSAARGCINGSFGLGGYLCKKRCKESEKGEAGRIRRVKCRKSEYENQLFIKSVKSLR